MNHSAQLSRPSKRLPKPVWAYWQTECNRVVGTKMPRQSHRFAILLGLGVLARSLRLRRRGASELRQGAQDAGAPDGRLHGLRQRDEAQQAGLRQPEGQSVMTSVPWDICACQSKTMITVFEDDRHKAISSFATYMALETKKRPPRFSKKDMKPKLKSPDVAKRLERPSTPASRPTRTPTRKRPPNSSSFCRPRSPRRRRTARQRPRRDG